MSRKIRLSSRFIGVLALLLLAVPLTEAQEYVWAKQLTGTDPVSARHVALDSSGNVHTIGNLQGTADFDTGPGTVNLTSFGGRDIQISKFDSAGNYVWARQMGGTENDVGRGVVVDDIGNVYVTGYFTGTADVDPGPGTLNLVSANSDAFVAKLDSSGQLVWARQVTGTGFTATYDITLDDSGNVYTSGLFYETADFDPGPGTANLTAVGSYDAFVWKLDTSGNHVWVAGAGGSTFDVPYRVGTDSAGNVYTAGFFSETADFDPGAGTDDMTSGGDSDPFIWKLDSTGNLMWARQMSGLLAGAVRGFELDGDGNIYATGFFEGTADFDPGAGTTNLTAVGSDSFVIKLDAAGNLVWARQLGGPDNELGMGVALDSADTVYTVGRFRDTVDFDPGPGAFPLSADGQDVYVSRLDAAGNFLSALQMGGPLDDGAGDVALDSSGNIHTVGGFQGTADFDPGPGTALLMTTSTNAGFVSKLGTVCGDGILDPVEECDDGNTDGGDGCAADCSSEVAAVPVVSIWGLIAVLLLLLAALAMVLTRQQRQHA